MGRTLIRRPGGAGLSAPAGAYPSPGTARTPRAATRTPTSRTSMFRRLTAALRHCRFLLRDGVYTVRGWVSDWFAILTAPFRLFRPRQFGSEMAFGGRELLGLVRGFFGLLAGLAAGFV